MKALHNDQIHAPSFIKECTHIWSDDVSRSQKSGVYDYYVGISKEFNLPLVDHTNFPQSGVVFVGMCHLLESVLQSMPTSGNYIIVHRTNDRPFTQEMYAVKPKSVKHIYSVDSQVYAHDVSAIPFGNASINGEDELVKKVATTEYFEKLPTTKLFVCFNTNPDTPHRIEAIKVLKDKPFAFVYELEYPHKQMDGEIFYKNVKHHKYTMALAGCGADASRQWAAIQLGSIPIVTDCPEMRHFSDLPLIYCPNDMNDITDEWFNEQDVSGKSTERMRMSYWQQHIESKRKEYSI